MTGNAAPHVTRPSRVTPRRIALALFVVVFLLALVLLGVWSWPAMQRAPRPASEDAASSSPSNPQRSGRSSSAPSDSDEGTARPRDPSSLPSSERDRPTVREESPVVDPRLPIAPVVAPARAPSPRSETPADVTFENTCSVPIELFWIDFEGELRWYGYVGRGSVVTQTSFEGHRWIARPRGESRELVTSVAGEGSTHVEVCPTGDPLHDLSPPSDVPPGGAPRRCTTEGGASMTLAWTNTCAAPIEMQWVDFTCERRPYTTLAPGQTRTQQTFVGHVWRAEDPSGRVLFERPANAAEAHWILRCDDASSFVSAP